MTTRLRRRCFWAAAATITFGGAALLVPLRAQDAPRVVIPRRATRLFNGSDLSGWYTFFPSRGVDSDPEKIITVEESGIVHITGKEFGYLATRQSYANYRLSFEVKWGERRWPPRENAVRDSGALLHCIGPDKVWIKSFECQIQEGDFGDIHHIGGISSVVGGKRQTGRVVKKSNQEKPRGMWNTVEVICAGDRITNVVNGVPVNVADGASQTQSGAGPALSHGKIAFQSEGAEVYYRNIVLRPL